MNKSLFSFRAIIFPIVVMILALLVPSGVSYSYYNPKSHIIQPHFHPSAAIDFHTDSIPDINVKAITAKAGLLYDQTDNKVVWVKDMNGKFEIASLTKMMTVLLVMDNINQGQYSWDSLVKTPKEATFVGGSSVYLRENEVFSVRDLVKSALIASGNDAAFTLAVYTAGSEKQFVNLMNWKAAMLGMDSTFYSNSTGMPTYGYGKDNYSTPHDLLILATELLKYPEILQYTSEKEDFIYHGVEKTVFKTHNSLVTHYNADIDGLKTGYTKGAGFCLVASAHRKDHRLIGIMLGVPTSASRDAMVGDMMSDYYFYLGLGRLGEAEMIPKK